MSRLGNGQHVIRRGRQTSRRFTRRLSGLNRTHHTNHQRAPTPLGRVTVSHHRFNTKGLTSQPRRATHFFRRARFTTLIMTGLFQRFFKDSNRNRLFNLRLSTDRTTFVRHQRVAPTVTREYVNVNNNQRSRLNITRIRRTFFTTTFRRILKRYRITTPNQSHNFSFAILLPNRMTRQSIHRNNRTLSSRQVNNSTTTGSLPNDHVDQNISQHPTALTPTLGSIRRRPLFTDSMAYNGHRGTSPATQSLGHSHGHSDVDSTR